MFPSVGSRACISAEFDDFEKQMVQGGANLVQHLSHENRDVNRWLSNRVPVFVFAVRLKKCSCTADCWRSWQCNHRERFDD